MTAQLLELAVRHAATGSAYRVVSTDTGFEVCLDLVEAHRRGLVSAAHTRTTLTHQVRVAGNHYVITDVERGVTWGADGPNLGVSALHRAGRIVRARTHRTWTPRQGWHSDPSAEWSSEEGRRLITAAAEELGLSARWPWQALVALAMVVLTVAGFLVAGAVLLLR